jgi:hypothetical protein
MSDSHNTGHGGGHEIDEPPTKELFNIIWGLGALTLLSLVTCVQLFNNQQRDLMAERGKDASFVLEQYSKEMDAVTKGSGELSFKDSNGKEVKQRFVPLAVARELVLSKPDGLHAGAPPPGWQHPDDIAAGGQAAGAVPTPAPTPTPTDGAAVPAPTDGAAVPAPTDGAAVPTPTDGTAPAAAGTPGQPGAAAPAPAAPAPGAPAPGAPAPGAPAPAAAEPAKPAAPAEGKPAADPAKAADPHAGH